MYRRLSSPLRGGDGGGGDCANFYARSAYTPHPTLPRKGGGALDTQCAVAPGDIERHSRVKFYAKVSDIVRSSPATNDNCSAHELASVEPTFAGLLSETNCVGARQVSDFNAANFDYNRVRVVQISALKLQRRVAVVFNAGASSCTN